MRERRRATIQELRQAIECLPRATRVAMLDGIGRNEIIAGAYSDSGGICPMLAAHRAGGRTSAITFARAWDRFAFRDGGSRLRRSRKARRATERELLVLRSHLEASLLDDGPAPDLAAVKAEHQALIATRERAANRERDSNRGRAANRERAAEAADAAGRHRHRPGDPDRSRELRSRSGWAWLRPFRRYDEYERALERLRAQTETPELERV